LDTLTTPPFALCGVLPPHVADRTGEFAVSVVRVEPLDAPRKPQVDVKDVTVSTFCVLQRHRVRILSVADQQERVIGAVFEFA
jgi:hypothetical protein